MKIILQSEASECGLACLTMVANSFGHSFDLTAMRRRFPASSSGLNLRNLIYYAAEIDLSARALRVTNENLGFVSLPAILHWQDRHFVVLEKLSRRVAIVIDPARGRIRIPRKELHQYTNGVLLEFAKASKFTPQNDRKKISIRSLFAGTKGLKRTLWQVIALTIIIQAVTVLSPLYIQIVVDRAIVNSDYQLLLILAIAFASLSFLNALSEYVRDWVVLVLSQTLSFQMISNVVRHLLRVKTEFFEKRHIGDILSRMSSLQPIRQAFTQTSIAVLVDSFMAISLLVVMMTYSILLTSIALISTSILVASSQVIIFFLRKRQTEQLINSANEQTHLLETIRSTRAIKLFGRELEREAKWKELYSTLMASNIRLGNLQYLNSFVISAIIGIQSVLLIYLGGKLVIENTLTMGMLFAFLAYQANFSNRTTSLINGLVEFGLLKVHFGRLGDIVNEEQEEVFGTGEEIDEISGFELVNVDFRYDYDGRKILDGVNLKVRPGEFVAIKGPSGEGKTTLLKVILGLLTPTAGEVVVNGNSLENFGLRNWRKLFGVVMQDDQLMSGSIANNISFYDEDPDIELVRRSAKRAGLAQDISEMKMKYDSLIGDMGSTLSGGQRQRLLIARALYKNPKILLLDEGTANLDRESEIEIANFIEKMDVTRVIVAHKPELISRADRVIELRGGRFHTVTQRSEAEG